MLCDVGGWLLFLCYLFNGSADGNQRGRTSKHVWPWAVTANLNKHLSEAKRIWSAEININERSHRPTTCQLKSFSLICIFPVLKVDLLSFLASYFYPIRAALHDSQIKMTLTYLCLPSSASCLEQAVLTAVYLRCPSLKLLLELILQRPVGGAAPRTAESNYWSDTFKCKFLLFFAPHNGNLLHKQNVSQNVQKCPKHSASFF